MKMLSSGRIIPAHLRKLFALAVICTASMAAQSLETLAHQYRDKATPARRNAIRQYATAHPKDQNGALALLAMGISEHEQKLWPAAIQNLKAAESRLPALRDYIAWFIASSYFEQEDYDSAAREAAVSYRTGLASPVTGKAAILGARALLKLGRAKEAVQVLHASSFDLPQPQGSLALGDAFDAAGDPLSAVAQYQMLTIPFHLTILEWIQSQYPIFSSLGYQQILGASLVLISHFI